MNRHSASSSRHPENTNVGASVLAAAIVLTVAFATSSLAQKHDVLSGFQVSGEYELLKEGSPVDAEVALSQRAAALLVTSQALEQPILIFARTKRVDRIQDTALMRTDDTIDLAANLEREYLGDFTQEGPELILPGDNLRLRPKPPLLGAREIGDLLQHSPGYREGMRGYRLDPEMVAELASITDPVQVRVVFGSWCGHCKHYLPHILKLEETLRSRNVDFDYYGIDYPPAGWEDSEVKSLGVSSLPTAIVYRNGEEVGRVSGGKGFERIERTLVDALD